MGSMILLSLRASRHKRTDPSGLLTQRIGLLYGEELLSTILQLIIRDISALTVGHRENGIRYVLILNGVSLETLNLQVYREFNPGRVRKICWYFRNNIIAWSHCALSIVEIEVRLSIMSCMGS